MRIKITKRALIERIRRKLARDKIRFLTNRGGPNSEELGKFFLIDQGNHIIGPYINDLEKYGRELGVLAEYEELSE